MAERAQKTAQPGRRGPAPAVANMELASAPDSATEGAAVSAGGLTARHAALLADTRLGQTANQAQRFRLMRQLQRGHGNAHVARVLALQRPTAHGVGVLQRAECPAPAVTRPPVEPQDDPAFQGVTAKVRQAATRSRQHPTASSTAAAAQAAAAGPANEVASQAKAGQVDKMGQQQPGVFDKRAFASAVRAAVAAATPKNLDEAEKYKDSGKAGQVKSQVAGLVTGGRETAERDIKQATQAAPDASNARPKPVTPLKPLPPGAPGSVAAAKGMPKAKPDDEVTFAHDQCQTNSQMSEAGVTEEQLATSNEPQFNEALSAKHAADAHSAEAPAAYRQTEQETLGQARTAATAAASPGMAGLHTARTSALQQVRGSQGAGRTGDEAKRAQVASELEAIYSRTRTDVTTILDGIETRVNTTFDTGEKAAREAMENHIDSRTRDFKLRRYLIQPGGSLLWIKDQFSSPPELNEFVAEGVRLFQTRMDTVIDAIADTVARDLDAAKARIARGRLEIKDKVAGLPRDLRQIGQELAQEIEGRFDQLDQDVVAKQQALVESLAQRYVEARDRANERANQLREANQSLWDRAKSAISGTIETILQLKNMLAGVLARAAGAIDKIITDPIGFLGNLVSAIKQGLGRFVGNIATHLQRGLMGWLFGTLAEAGIQIPTSFDLKGILSLVLQLLGVTYANIRARVVGMVGEETVGRMEQVTEVFKVLISEGPAGLWRFIQDKLTELKEQALDQIKEFVITKIVTAGITWLMSMLNPASAFVRACKMIIDVVMFFVERGGQIMSLVNAVIDSVSAIASGSLGGAAAAIEQALARAVPVAISFLASLLGLDGIAGKIKSIIERIQRPINSLIDKVIGGVVRGFRRVVGAARSRFGGRGRQGGLAAQTPAPGRAGPDQRSPAQKEAAETAAITDAEGYLNQPAATPELIRSKLPAIKQQHHLDSISLVAEGEATYHVTATINRKSSGSATLSGKPKITLSRPRSFWKDTKDELKAHYPDEHKGNTGKSKVKKGMARRHIVASQEVLEHLESTVNGCPTIAAAKKLLERNGETLPANPTNADLQAVVQERLKRFFNDVDNLMVGDSSENSSIQDDRDRPGNWDSRDMANHVKKMKNRYYLR